MRPATPNAPPNTPRRLVNRFILASHQTCRSFLRASLSERVHYPILTILTESGWARLDCARHHPLQSEQQRVPGTPSTSFVHGGGRLGWPSLRASTEHSIRQGPERINPECAVREQKGQPCRLAPLSCVRDARAREAAWPPQPPVMSARRAGTGDRPHRPPTHLHRCDSTTR